MRRILAYAAIVVATGGGLYATQVQTANRLRANQLAACSRGNVLREILNVNVEVTADFLRTATVVRSQAADLAQKQGNKKEARINQRAADRYQSQLDRLAPIEPVDCTLVIR